MQLSSEVATAALEFGVDVGATEAGAVGLADAFEVGDALGAPLGPTVGPLVGELLGDVGELLGDDVEPLGATEGDVDVTGTGELIDLFPLQAASAPAQTIAASVRPRLFLQRFHSFRASEMRREKRPTSQKAASM